jgi:hypothetical protein
MPTTGITASAAMRARTDMTVLYRISSRPAREAKSAKRETIPFSGQSERAPTGDRSAKPGNDVPPVGWNRGMVNNAWTRAGSAGCLPSRRVN